MPPIWSQANRLYDSSGCCIQRRRRLCGNRVQSEMDIRETLCKWRRFSLEIKEKISSKSCVQCEFIHCKILHFGDEGLCIKNFKMPIGEIGRFEDKGENFEDYCGRLEAYFGANQIANERKANTLIAVIGASGYQLMKTLCSPDNPNTKTYAELKTLLSNHYAPTPVTIAERHRFWTACQGESEAVSDFIVRLKKLAATCNFAAFYDQALRDRLVSGLHSRMRRAQQHLLTQRDLTFDVAKQYCVADEMATKAGEECMPGAVGGSCETNRVQASRQAKHYKKSVQSSASIKCKCCGGDHDPEGCKYKDATCYKCGKKGHIRPVCKVPGGLPRDGGPPRSSGPQKPRWNNKYKFRNRDSAKTHTVQSDEDDQPSEHNYGLYSTNDQKATKPYYIDISVGNSIINMEVDTGASRSTVCEHVYQNKLSNYELQECDVLLRSYVGEIVPCLGKITVPVVYNGETHDLDVIVVKGNRPSLLGRDWLKVIKLKWSEIFNVPCDKIKIPCTSSVELNKILEENKVVFSSENTGIKGFKASLKLKPDAKPVYQKDRPVPYSMVKEVEKEYERLIESDIWYPVSYNKWASPVVHVPKADGGIRVCGDYKAVNEAIESDGYKLPNVEDMFAKMCNSGDTPKVFSVLDLSGAFNQLLLDESSELLVLNTHKGLMGTKRLCFGVKTASTVFQATMDKILNGIDHVLCRVDDILVATATVEENLRVLKQVFARLVKHNVRLNASKCQFLVSKVIYMGHTVSGDGIRPIMSKAEAISNAPRPQNVPELRSFLGMVNYYSKFVGNLATKLSPLYELLKKQVEFVWSDDCETAFQHAKQVLTSDNLLVHYDCTKPIVLSVDASPYGLGAVLSHKFPDGSEKPIAFASRTLSDAERNYAQIEKEGLAIVFGIKRFHLYLYGRNFTLVTDHQPLTRIFGPKTNIPSMAAARMQRWAVLLSGYQYNIEYRSSAENANADLLSRLPMSDQEPDPDECYVFSLVTDKLPVTASKISEVTRKDPELCKVYEYTASGWPEHCSDSAMQPYFSRRYELSLDDGCILWGRRVVIPEKLQGSMLEELHECHPGMCRMKALARSFVWWPGIDQDIEDMVRQCDSCSRVLSAPKEVPLLLWPWATQPWQRVHMDYLEIKGQQFLLVVDSHSKWLEVFPMESTTASATITVVRSLFFEIWFARRSCNRQRSAVHCRRV